MTISSSEEANRETKPGSLKAALSHLPRPRIKEILGRFVRRRARLFGKISMDEGKSGTGSQRKDDGTLAELVAAGSELVDATESFLRCSLQPGFDKTESLRKSTDLLVFYDEYLHIVKRKIEERGHLPVSRATDNDDLIRLFVAFEFDRQLLAGLFALWKEGMSDETSNQSAEKPTSGITN